MAALRAKLTTQEKELKARFLETPYSKSQALVPIVTAPVGET